VDLYTPGRRGEGEDHAVIQLLASVHEQDKGLKHRKKKRFDWELTPEKWFTYAEMVSALKEGPSHHYFELAADDLPVVISNGEYGEDWIGWCE